MSQLLMFTFQAATTTTITITRPGLRLMPEVKNQQMGFTHHMIMETFVNSLNTEARLCLGTEEFTKEKEK